MLYVAFVKNKPRWQLGNVDFAAKSRRWWNEGERPAGLKTVAFYGALGTDTPDVLVFEATDHDDIRRMLEFWNEVDFDVHPAMDLIELFRRQGMQIA